MSLEPEQTHIGHYILGKTIGRGGYAKVKQARHDLTNLKVAVKIINKTRMKNKNMISKVKREIKILKFISHPNIIKLYEVLDTTTDIFVVMEMAQGGQLYEYIQNHDLTEEESKQFFRQIIDGVEFAHKNLVAHRDLKPQNIILNSKKVLKIADFGLSNLMKDGKMLKTFCGSLNYAAPQILGHRQYEGTSVDIWSCGVILYTMLVGALPFDQEVVQVLYRKIQKAEYDIPAFVSAPARDLMRKMLQANPIDRIKISEIKNHPWLRQKIPLYSKIPSTYIDLIDKDFIFDGQIFQKLKQYNIESLNKIKDIERVKKILKKRMDDSFVVTYEMLKDQKQNYQVIPSNNINKNAIDTFIFNPVANKISRKKYEPENNHIYGNNYDKSAKILVDYIFKLFAKMNIEFIIKNNQYRLLCKYTKQDRDVKRKGSEIQSDNYYEQTDESERMSKKNFKFIMQLYSANSKNSQTIVDIQLTQGHPIMFINIVHTFYKLLQAQINQN